MVAVESETLMSNLEKEAIACAAMASSVPFSPTRRIGVCSHTSFDHYGLRSFQRFKGTHGSKPLGN
jgi:hypothetical protein